MAPDSTTTDGDVAKIRAFLARHVRAAAIADDDNIFASGFVNSLFAMELVAFVERQFQIAVENEDLDLANFMSIRAIAAFVQRKQATCPR